MTSRRERLQAALAGEKADRPPVALWRHFPVDDQDPRSLADATLDFQAQFDFDFIKVTPASSFCVKDWGVEDAWKGDAEGTREYTHYVIDQPRDWLRLKPLSPVRGWLGAHLKCLASLRERCAEDLPYLQTVFSPLSQARHLAGEARLLEHLRREPEYVLRALEVITQTTVAYVEAARAQGISGIFYAAQLASYQRMDRQGYCTIRRAVRPPCARGGKRPVAERPAHARRVDHVRPGDDLSGPGHQLA